MVEAPAHWDLSHPSPDLCLKTIILCWGAQDNFFDFSYSDTLITRETLYRQVSVFPNHVQSAEFRTGGLQ